MDEKTLLEKARSGDRKSLELLLYDNYKIVYGYLLKLTMNEEVTKDLTQDVMMKAILNIKKFKGESKFSTWLISIASNLYKNYIRKNKKISNKTIEDLSLKDSQDIEHAVINKDTVKRIGKLLMDFPYEKRMVFILKNYYDYSYEEISKILKCPIGTVRSRLHYCIEKLRNLI
ncbi:sigma-70 family RNA polymerase sigma factor [Acetivibrio clariflavus]|uniref:RNA polymerase sigma factor, sigma-70 family n=1 Tax=Acetivibrio clariflavus (strain DSM 19732 / NBRC 101661 / EBR45) TaxID=720554 RepID=G8LUV4_ACECE|nr:sigma-70 family RNA polymerase sigma factor [Acetivibrio clariflavus]AEV68484.1 RNA polymerase sigma factor, sigma-70 family [Acetivibrio clariflavus DSM 19732]